ncbi:MAG: hypothetical protein H6825_16815, partial [Planctomycetes bacterium]|nr:hypothetical protein [Planctomycetota bacterium]
FVHWIVLLTLASLAMFVHFALGALVLLLGLRMGLDRRAIRRASGPPSPTSGRKAR